MMHFFKELVVAVALFPALSLLAKATVVVALGLISICLARRSRAVVRHAVLTATFGILLALPVASVIAPPVPVALAVETGNRSVSSFPDSIALPLAGKPVAEHLRTVPRKSGWSAPPLSVVGLYAWFLGIALFMIPIARGLLQLRSLRRDCVPWSQGRRMARDLAPDVYRQIDILLNESVSGPLTCGILRPAIILPADAPGWSEQDVERALIHELEHVRRYDWIIHCFARIACAVYWFHPLVWVTWRRLILEAERSCDDEVLKRFEATAYADQLVKLARRRRLPKVRKSPALAMANRSDLAARVSSMLERRQARGRAGVFLVAGACIAATIITLAMSPLRMVAAPQNVRASVQTNFEAASLHLAEPGDMKGWRGGCHGVDSKNGGDINSANIMNIPLGRCVITDARLSHMIAFAWHLEEIAMIQNAPDWVIDTDERYTLQAKAEDTKATEAHLREMLQRLLIERFQLKYHREERDEKGYDLVVAKSGPKMEKSREDDISGLGSFIRGTPTIAITATGYSMDALAQFLSLFGPGHVRDKTGLDDLYNFKLTWNDTEGPSVFSAIERIGLQLQPAMVPISHFVIESAQRPTAN